MLDRKYKETIAQNLGITDLELLNPIVGEEEFKEILKTLTEEDYKPGQRYDDEVFDAFDKTNIESGKFIANLHVHTTHSDGLGSVKMLLDDAAELAEKSGKFIMAITDHDTMAGSKEALELIVKNPEKYKKIKVVLGLEISTFGTKFEKQKYTIDIHTLVYCINPYNKELNEFIDTKLDKKFKLTKHTLNHLQKHMSDLFEKLNIKLDIYEAEKIHPMIDKGQDEISHALKKYIYAKTLFSYYVENNKEILDTLKKYNVEQDAISYQKPVHKYKKMFNNERYFYIYREALQKYLRFLTNDEVEFELEEIPEEIVNNLLKGKAICESSHPSLSYTHDAFAPFEETLEFINGLDSGLACIAHPGRLVLKHSEKEPKEFFEEFFSVFKKYGKEKAYAYEKYYLSYIGKKKDILCPIIDEIADSFDLKYTGGIDSHGFDVRTRKPYF